MENLRGSLLMTLAMFGFAVEDVLIKFMAGSIPPGQIILLIGAGGAVTIAVWLRLTGQAILPAALFERRVVLRTGCEALGTAFFVTSLSLIPVTTASAVIQATPLVVALGGALFLGQRVGWRRWMAILVGLGGVLLILRPGTDSFQPAVVLAVIGMLGLASRDLFTRAISSPVTGTQLTLAAFLALVPTGLVLCWVSGQPLIRLSPGQWGLIGLAVLIGLVAYLAIVAATRAGDVAVTSSFRYSRMVFALILGAAVFAERPDAPTLIGAAIIILAGLYALIREARSFHSAPPPLQGEHTDVSANTPKRNAP